MRKKLLKLLLLIVLLFLPRLGGTNAWYSDTEKTTGNALSTGCWATPGFDSHWLGMLPYTSALNVSFGWPDGASSCPTADLSYRIEIFTDSGLTASFAQSGWTALHSYAVNNIPEGEYWYRIKVKDQYDNEGSSSVFHLTVDRTGPGVTLSISGSWSKLVEEKIINGDFTDGLSGWSKTGDVAVVSLGGTLAARIGKPSYPSDEGKMVWENRLMQSFPTGAKTLAVDYRFFTYDSGVSDDPGFLIKLNGIDVFHRNSTDGNSSGWETFTYDLSSFNGNNIDLSLNSGNTLDKVNQSLVYINKVSTYYVAAPTHATYLLSSSEDGVCEYSVDSGTWKQGGVFTIADGGTHHVRYRCMDNSGNFSAIQEAVVITDAAAPGRVLDLSAYSVFPNQAILNWTAPGNDGFFGQAASYDIRYSTTPITDNSSFDAATRVPQVSQPQPAGYFENFAVNGLNPDITYYFALRTADEAPNWSEISDFATAATPANEPVEAISEGDVIINELMWMGTGADPGGPDDEYIELRNTTDRLIDLSTLKLAGITADIDFAGEAIAPHGYFLISHFAPGSTSSHLKSGISADIVEPGIVLPNTTFEILLIDMANGDYVIDRAWDPDYPITEGLHDGSKHYSMERIAGVGDGANPLSWYTSLDPTTTSQYFTGSSERGTPGAQNRGETEIASDIIPATESAQIAASEAAMPKVNLLLADDEKKVSFTLSDIDPFVRFDYELKYETDTVTQGVTGNVSLSGDSTLTREIVLGTCSTGGTCVYHTGVYNFVLQVWLFRPDGSSVLLKKDL